MEDGLVLGATLSVTIERYGLNPYCSGRWSRTHSPSRNGSSRSVLILIVVDDGLVHCASVHLEIAS